MNNLYVCCVCKNDLIKNKVVSIYQISDKGGRTTKAVCDDCFDKTKQKWTENNWKIMPKTVDEKLQEVRNKKARITATSEIVDNVKSFFNE